MLKESHTINVEQKNAATEEKSTQNTLDIFNPEAQGTIRIIYGGHFTPEDPKSISSNCEGLFLEESGYDLSNPVDTLNHDLGKLPAVTGTADGTTSITIGTNQYSQLANRLETSRVPVYFPDINLSNPWSLIGETTMDVGETLIGLYLLKSMPEKIKQHMSRREFLQLSLDVAKLGLGAWLTSPLLTSIARGASIIAGHGGELTRTLKQADYTVHPEESFFSVTIRNTIFAEKMCYLMQRERKEQIDIILGALHVVEHPFKTTSQERMKFLKKCKDIGMLGPKQINPLTLYSMPEMSYDGSSWKTVQTIEIPTLKSLV